MDDARWLALGLEVEPLGDRELTEVYYFKSKEDIARIWPQVRFSLS